MLNIPEIRFFTLKSLRMRHLWMFVLDICVLFNWPIKIRMAGGGLLGIINIVSIGLPDNTFTIQTWTTNLREVSHCPKKTPTWAFSLLYCKRLMPLSELIKWRVALKIFANQTAYLLWSFGQFIKIMSWIEADLVRAELPGTWDLGHGTWEPSWVVTYLGFYHRPPLAAPSTGN